jgi:hypothetical protein
MKRKNKIRFDIVSLICAVVIVVTSAAPLFSEHTDARFLALIFGAIGTGAMLSNLIHDIKRGSDDEEKHAEHE